jgi:hypothetical protein
VANPKHSSPRHELSYANQAQEYEWLSQRGLSSLRVKRWCVELTTHIHLVPRSKNGWSYISTLQYAFMAWCLVKAQG